MGPLWVSFDMWVKLYGDDESKDEVEVLAQAYHFIMH